MLSHCVNGKGAGEDTVMMCIRGKASGKTIRERYHDREKAYVNESNIKRALFCAFTILFWMGNMLINSSPYAVELMQTPPGFLGADKVIDLRLGAVGYPYQPVSRRCWRFMTTNMLIVATLWSSSRRRSRRSRAKRGSRRRR